MAMYHVIGTRSFLAQVNATSEKSALNQVKKVIEDHGEVWRKVKKLRAYKTYKIGRVGIIFRPCFD